MKILRRSFFLLLAAAEAIIVGVSAASTTERSSSLPAPRHHRHHPKARGERVLQQATDDDNNSTTTTMITALLRRRLLSDYDKGSFPFEKVWGWTDNDTNRTTTTTDNVRQGLRVEVGFNFHRVFAVDVTNAVADLIVWARQRWNDPRLVWDEEMYGGIKTLHFWVGDGSGAAGETSEIWTPDLQLWNMESPLDSSLADAYAVVNSDGTVFWSRPGHVKPVCKFQGLDDFPFDTLACTMEIGSWAYSGLYIRPVKMDKGYTVGGSETAGEAFAEFSLVDVDCEEYMYPPYPSAPEEDWPVLLYHVTFQRAWQPYARGYLVLQVILNLAAFCCFWLPPHVGERMSLAITALLAAVASELVVAAKLPAASEVTWFSKFSLMSTMFTALVLFESAAVIYFYYHTGDDLVPKWYRWMRGKIRAARTDKETGQKVRFERNEKPTKEPEKTSHSGGSTGEDASPTTRQEVDGEFEATTMTHENSEQNGRDDHSSSDGVSEASFPSAPDRCGANQTNNFEPSDFRRSSFQTRKKIKTILGRDADDFRNAREMENNARWQQVAISIDEVARVILPAAFCIAIAITFSRLNV